MLGMLKKMDKKFLITSGCLILIPLIIVLVLVIIRGCSAGSSYEKYQRSMVKNAEKYFKYHDLLPSSEGKEAVATLDELVMDGLKSPEKAVKDSSCTGSVTVRNNGGEYFYTPYLECSDYTTDYIVNHLKDDMVTKESGLYKINDEYIFKGNKVDNYVSFFGTIYRVIKIDSDGNLRMVKASREENQVSWDDKYNVSADDTIGINDYYNSSIYDTLWESYNNVKTVTKEMKQHLLSHTVCLDKKEIANKDIEVTVCSNPLKGQFISLPTIYDYALASYDKDCKNIGDGACANYNYLDDVLTSTWTSNSSADDTYSVYYLAGSYVDVQQAEAYKSYHWVISVDGNELYTGGTGTVSDPYIIKND